MKRIIILLFTVVIAFSAYSQTFLEDGDRCFDSGDYACAEIKYSEALKSTSGRNKQIIELKLAKARNCMEWKKVADTAFNSRNYEEAKEYYQKVLVSNPNDPYAKSQLVKMLPPVTLKVSTQDLSFLPAGGTKSITVTITNTDTYDITSLPDWCSVKKYSGSFEVTCKPYTGNSTRSDKFKVTAGNKEVIVNISQAAANLSVSSGNLSFLSTGGTKNITVTTNAETYDVVSLPDWCSVTKKSDAFEVTCKPNTGYSARSGEFKVTAGGKEVTINVSQIVINLKVSSDNLSFSSSGGTQSITVTTNADNYAVSFLPAWCSIKKYSTYFTVTCNSNPDGSSKNQWFSVKAGDKEIEIYVKQAACFNCPKGDPHPIGLSLGYVQKQWVWKTDEETAKFGAWDKNESYLAGMQVGVRVEPLFKYGFGLNTGLFYEYYQSLSDKQTGTYTDMPGEFEYRATYSEHSLYLPLHLEYRLNLSKYFQLFVEAGPSIDFGLGAKLTALADGDDEPFFTETNIYRNSELGFPNKRLNASFDFGAGFRLNKLQFNVGMSKGLLNISSNSDINITQNKNLTASLSWMIPYDENRNDMPVNSVDKDDYRTGGITFGYISKQWEWQKEQYTGKCGLWEDSKYVSGLRFGFAYQPQFIYGFGLTTGLFLDTYISISNDEYDTYGTDSWTFSEYAIHLPVHAEYRLHFSEKFSVFFEAGPSFDLGLSAQIKDSDYTTIENDLYGKTEWGYPTKRFNMYLDFGGGIRMNRVQLNAGVSRGLSEVEFDDGWKVRQNRNLNLGFTWFW